MKKSPFQELQNIRIEKRQIVPIVSTMIVIFALVAIFLTAPEIEAPPSPQQVPLGKPKAKSAPVIFSDSLSEKSEGKLLDRRRAGHETPKE